MKKIVSLVSAAVLCLGLFSACGTAAPAPSAAPADSAEPSGISGYISVISREDGSGTRGAFIELFGIEQKDSNGNKVDHTTADAEITNSTAVMLTTVACNESAVGYVSLGSLNDSVKALKIDGADATVENIKSGDYKIARPFNIAVKDGVGEAAKDFIDYIMSDEGQKIVEDNGYISQGSTGAFAGGSVTGTVTVAGSSSVSPVMEKLAEAYMALNSGVTIELQTSDSTTGMTSASEGLCDIGMASRELKDSEKEAGLTSTVIAMDGIAVIVNLDNSTDELSSDTVMGIFTGEITDWSEIA